MSEKKTLLSIHVSVFNLEKYIEQCLESILQQVFDDYELILVDNGSTDQSIEICERYVKAYPDKIKFKKFPLPTVVGRPYEYAIACARGKYFMAVDGDDYITEGCLTKIASIIKGRNPDVILGSFINDVEPGCTALRDTSIDPDKINGVLYSDVLNYLATVPNFHTVQWRFIVSRNILKKFMKKFLVFRKRYVNLMKESKYGDAIRVLFILVSAKSIEFMKEPFYVYRSRSTSLSAAPDNNRSIALLSQLIIIGGCLRIDRRREYQDFVRAQIHKFYMLYLQVCTSVSEAGYLKMTRLIETYTKEFSQLKESGILPVTEFCDLLNRNGIHKGLTMFTKLQETKLISKLQLLFGRDVYIFPTGICGESTLLLLKSKNIEVKGFLDNDFTKEVLKFKGYPCLLPERLTTLSEEQRQSIVVVIATCYEHLITVLKKQLNNLGIFNSQIIIRE
ncbi:MAG: glycosyl transferase family 2 [Firmicutes bacterium]|nr:glycosyl transferase family 2 [Bacillota bacterium]